ncbi:MAG: alpha/beta-type small acid-soluble spore protein [Alicyclobacillus sp.]|nr:alpha/beta-type small acid-soluble spore protein [Alicyclobacillus sp.]
MGRRRRSLLVPEARPALEQLKQQVVLEKLGAPGRTPAPVSRPVSELAKSVGIPYRPQGDNGGLTARQAGKVGGEIGGAMVQRLIAMAEQQLAKSAKSAGQP